MHRFFCTYTGQSAKSLAITDKNEIHHIKNVLRLKVGDKICIFDGQGAEAIARINLIKSKSVSMEIASLKKHEKKLPEIILACAIPKKSKFETIIEKCTELGVSEIIPMITQRTEVSVTPDKKARKLERYNTVALNAAKQSKRAWLPKIHPVMSFTDVLAVAGNINLTLIPCLSGNRKNIIGILKKLSPAPKKIMCIIGPEGDFTPEEIDSAISAGCIPASLGPTILKVETAAIAVSAVANLFFDNEK